MSEPKMMDDIERLENRLRTNFFEVEKRLSTLESNLTTTSIDELKERLQEIEDLQMLLQAEFLQIRQQSGNETAVPGSGDVEKRISKVEEIVTKGVPVAVQKDIEGRIEKMEKAISSIDTRKITDASVTRSAYSQSAPNFPDISPLQKRLELLEKAPRVSNLPEGLSRKIDAIDQASAKKADILPITKRLENMERMVEERTDNAGMMKRLDFTESMLKDTRAYYSKKISELEDSIERSGKILTEEGMRGFLNRIYETRNEISRKVEEFESAKDRLEKIIRDRQELIGRLEQSEVNVSKADAILIKIRTEASKLQNLEEKLNSVEQRMNMMVRDKIGDMESIRSDLFERIRKINDKVSADLDKSSSLREEMVAKLEDELEKSASMKNELASRAEELSKGLERLQSRYDEMDVENRLQMGVSELRMKFDQMATETQKTITSRLKDIESLASEGSRALKSASEIEKRINSRAEAILKNEKYGNVDERIDGIRKSYMEESQKQWSEMRKLHDSIKSLESAIARQQDSPAHALEEELQKHQGQITRIGDSVKNLESRLIAMNPHGDSDAKKLLEEVRRLAEAERGLESRVGSEGVDAKSLENLRKSYSSESEKQWNEIRKMESKISALESRHGQSDDERAYENAAKAMNDYLKRFSSSIEARLDSMQKGIYSRLKNEMETEISRKPQVQRTVNMDPVISKISDLERELIRLERSLRAAPARMPLVIE